ncbi:FAD-dependent oxidoreductase [Luteipulveratus sp. YIM 133132]|uniref:FAD-dependent oxidoreductase n=1 Tax=Luteipulveratus flavus TaxID=3031728 RepID=UPI0023AF1EC7|nr:FAD-dependent oxidoreductase [Luteipulveratus sp. YIM 133132]MDE9367225.1 FAD-dependent oxidoreductase [Luteipulveratus sp. YIM 133132]
MEQLQVDVLVIGWGKGGKTLAGALGRAGRSVAVVERSNRMYGGSCINIACVPTKALVHRAEQRRFADDAQAWFDAAVQERDDLTGRLRARNHAMLKEVDAVTLIDGAARFVGPREVEVTAGGERLRVSAETVVVNTGTEPARPPVAGADGPHVYDSTSLQHVSPFPRRLVVVGGGFVGLEFAGMFARFGSQVTVLNRGERLLPEEDADAAAAVEQSLVDAGVTFRHGTSATAFVDARPTVVVQVDGPGEATDLEADAVLCATGRRPVTADLDLSAAGVDTDERGYIVVDDHLRTSADGVYAVGDVNGGPQFTFISLDDHRVVLSALTGDGSRTAKDRVAVPRTTFITPPFARVGINATQARDQGRSVLVASKPVADIAAMPRPKIVEETHGLIGFVVDAESDEVLGATLFCTDAQELVNLVALAMRAGVTASRLRDGIWTHPSTTEALNEVLAGLRPLA